MLNVVSDIFIQVFKMFGHNKFTLVCLHQNAHIFIIYV